MFRRNRKKTNDPLRESIKEIEQMRKELQLQISENQARQLLDAMFESLPLGALIFTVPEGLILRSNPLFCKYLGCNESEIKGLPITGMLHPDDVVRTTQANQAVAESMENPNKWIHTFENRWLTKTGEYVWITWRAGTFTKLAVPGVSHGFCERVTDVDEIKRLNNRYSNERAG